MVSQTPGDKVKKTSVGGQALIEGMLMIGPRKVAIAVRKPDGEIVLKVDPLPERTRAQKIPLIRGAVNLFRQMKIGISALMYSAEFFDIEDDDADSAGGFESHDTRQVISEDYKIDADNKAAVGEATDKDANTGKGESADTAKKSVEEPSRFEKFIEDKLGDKAKDVVIYIAVAVSLCFSVGLFILLPNFIAGFLMFDKTNRAELLLSNLCEGVIRVGLFLGYLSLSSRMREIRRVWQYHGAEHKTINCFEHGAPLEVESIRKYSTKHPRCGTSFMFLVMIISILIFSLVDIATLALPFQFVGVAKVLSSLVIRLITIPFVAGAAYEIIKLAGRYDNPVTRVISMPGMMFQRFTTREPDDDMLSVAIAAFEAAISDDEKEMAW